MEKKGNKSKKQRRKFAGTENKIKDIMPTNKHRTKLMLREKYISYIHINLKTINPSRNE